MSVDDLAERIRVRLASVNFAGIFARAREEGISAAGLPLAEEVRMTATEAAYGNTEIHYAFELLQVLARIRASTFVFGSPPVHGKVSPEVIALLREATRAYLFGLEHSCVSICRALLEDALRGHVKPADLLKEVWRSKRGELECLINLCEGKLGKKLSRQAHAIRVAGNKALHQKGSAGRSTVDAWPYSSTRGPSLRPYASEMLAEQPNSRLQPTALADIAERRGRNASWPRFRPLFSDWQSCIIQTYFKRTWRQSARPRGCSESSGAYSLLKDKPQRKSHDQRATREQSAADEVVPSA